MTLIEILLDIVSKIPADTDGNTFSSYYGETGWENLIADNATYPMVSIDFIRSVNLELPKSGYIGEWYPVTAFFGYKSELDWTTLQHEEVIAKSTTAARNFISQLQNYSDSNRNKLIDVIKFVSANRVILRPSDDVGTSGILLQLNVNPVINLSVCV